MSERIRCGWAKLTHAPMVAYHDQEWGVPLHDDRRHFEFILLDGAQAGLSWEITLKSQLDEVMDLVARKQRAMTGAGTNAGGGT